MIVQNTKIKTGYKQTEVGEIPEDWEIDSLKRFWTVVDCKHLTAKFVENGIPLASIREVQSRFVELENAKQTTQLYYLALIEGGRKPQSGDLIFSRNVTVGEIAQVAEWHPPFAMGQDVCLLRKKHSGFSSDYLQAVVRSPIVLKQFANFMVGSTFKRVNVKQIQKLIVPMPLPEEQTAIATVLSDFDSLIEALDKLITKKRDIKQATMQQLLTGKTRLPGFGGESKPGYKETEMGMIPEEWEVKKLGDIANIYRGASPRPIEDPKWFNEYSNIGWVRISDVTKSVKYLFNTTQHLSEQGIKQSRFVKQENLIMSICATIGKPIVVKIDVCIHDGFVLFERPKVNTEYLYYYLSFIEDNWSKNGQTGSQMNLNTTIIGNENISFPNNPEEQAAIASILSNMDAEITALEQKRNKYRALKQGMMQELLTGRTRLK